MYLLTLDEVRAENFLESLYPDDRVTEAVEEIEEFLEEVTGNWFEPRTLTLRLDGENTEDLFVPHPIIKVTEIKIVTSTVLLSDVKIYNRHLFGQKIPDDRKNPMISFNRDDETEFYRKDSLYGLPSRRWPDGIQNITVTGSFGYRDYNTAEPDPDDPVGKVPTIAKRVAKMLLARYLEPVNSSYSSEAWRGHDVKRRKTRTQEVEMGGPIASGKLVGSLTGDVTIDRMLSKLMRPTGGGLV